MPGQWQDEKTEMGTVLSLACHERTGFLLAGLLVTTHLQPIIISFNPIFNYTKCIMIRQFNENNIEKYFYIKILEHFHCYGQQRTQTISIYTQCNWVAKTTFLTTWSPNEVTYAPLVVNTDTLWRTPTHYGEHRHIMENTNTLWRTTSATNTY